MGEERRDPESGQYTPDVTDPELLSILESREPAGSSEIADEAGLTQQAVHYRLSKLEEEDKVESKMVGGNRIWMSG